MTPATTHDEATITGHLAPIAGVAIGQDSSLYTVSYDGALCAWRLQGHQLTSNWRRYLHFKGVNCVAVDPTGRRIFTGGSDGRGRLVDSADSARAPHVIEHPVDIECAVFSADGTRVLSGGTDGTARIWDAADGSLLHTVAHGKTVGATCLSQDPRLVATGCNDRGVRLVEWATGKVVKASFPHQGPVKALILTCRGLVSAGHDGNVFLLDDELRIRELVACFTTTPKTLAVEPGGEAFWIGAYDQTVSRWEVNPATGPAFRRVQCVVDSGRAWMHGLAATHRMAWVGSFDGAPLGYPAGAEQPLPTPPTHVGCISSISINRASGQVLASGDSGEIRATATVPQGLKGAAPGEVIAKVSGAVTAVAGSASDFVCGAWDGRITRFVGGRPHWTATWVLPGGTTADRGQSPIVKLDRGPREVVAALYTGGAACFSVETGQMLWAQREATGAVKSVSISGRYFAMTGRYDPLRVGDLSTGELLGRLELATPVSDQVRFSPYAPPDRPRLAVVAGKHEVWIVDVVPGARGLSLQVRHVGTGHELPIKALAWVDAETVTSGCYGGRLMLHRVGAPSVQLGVAETRLGISALECDESGLTWASFDGCVGRIQVGPSSAPRAA